MKIFPNISLQDQTSNHLFMMNIGLFDLFVRFCAVSFLSVAVSLVLVTKICVFLLLGYCQLDFYYSSESFDCYIGRNWLAWMKRFLLWSYLCAQDQQMECWKSALPNIQLLDHEDKDIAQQHSKHCLLHTATSRGWPIFWEESSPDVFLLRSSNCILINFISILVI